MRVSLLAVILLAPAATTGGCGSGSAPATEADASAPPTGTAPDEADDASLPDPGDPDGGAGHLLAGAARFDATPPVGLPLGGYGDRRRATPDLDPSNGATLFKASTGVRDPLHCRALVLANGQTRIGLVALDGVAVVGHFVTNVLARAKARGATLTADNTIVFASHSHSGPGAMTHLKFFELAAMDLHVPSAEDAFAESCARALATAESELAPATIGTGAVSVPGASTNRRAGTSPYVTPATVDTQLGVVRVDRPSGAPVAVLWSYAIHGTALGPDNLAFSADVMGVATAAVEAALPGSVALFANGAEGDAAPAGKMSATGASLGAGVLAARASATPRKGARLGIVSRTVDMGKATLKVPPGTIGDLGLGPVVGALTAGGAEIEMGPAFIEHDYRFSALRIDDEAFVTVPGEAIHEIGERLVVSGKALGFTRVTVVGLANGYLGYVTSAREHAVGGYEAAMTLFGEDTGERVVSECQATMLGLK